MLEYAIKNILDEITELKASPIFTTSIPGITYTITPVNGGVVKQDQVEIKVIHQDFDEALKIKDKILKKLDMTNKEPSLVNDDIVLRSQLAGGGSIFSDGPQCWELSIYLNITWRCI